MSLTPLPFFNLIVVSETALIFSYFKDNHLILQKKIHIKNILLLSSLCCILFSLYGNLQVIYSIPIMHLLRLINVSSQTLYLTFLPARNSPVLAYTEKEKSILWGSLSMILLMGIAVYLAVLDGYRIYYYPFC